MSPNIHALDCARTPEPGAQKPSRAEVEAAVKTIIRWTGEDPERDGLIETPAGVTRSFEEHFSGYSQDQLEILEKTFEEIEGYDEMIVLRDLRFESHCEHHMAPIIGRAWVAYVPRSRVVGVPKLARVVDVYTKRLQIQEKMMAQIANTINNVVKRQGVGAIIKATQVRHGPGHQPHARLLPRQFADPSGIPQHGDLMLCAAPKGEKNG